MADSLLNSVFGADSTHEDVVLVKWIYFFYDNFSLLIAPPYVFPLQNTWDRLL